MNGWLERKGLRLTSRGERVIVAATGAWIVGLAGVAFWIESIINASRGVF